MIVYRRSRKIESWYTVCHTVVDQGKHAYFYIYINIKMGNFSFELFVDW